MPKVRKAARMRLLKAELLIELASVTLRWANDVSDADTKTIPFAEWPHDDPLRKLADTYDLTGDDLAKILNQLGDELENRADRAGYDEAWRD